jgi:hypothetical protein
MMPMSEELARLHLDVRLAGKGDPSAPRSGGSRRQLSRIPDARFALPS